MTEEFSTTNILLLGESGVGKTHYGGQLLLRLNQGKGALRMRATAANLSPFEAALERLSEGRPAEHTATADYLESLWKVADRHGNATDLVWPDYGGEQIRTMLETRRIPSLWRQRLLRSDGWILFVRVQHADITEDVFSRPLASLASTPMANQEFRTSGQARLIELLQLMLYVRGIGILRRISAPALMVLLSCWDELGSAGEEVRPQEVLSQRLPLLADFVLANWHPRRARILGLSALGRSLRKDNPDEEYIRRGPEHFGYIVRDDGKRNSDLTLPIAELARIV